MQRFFFHRPSIFGIQNLTQRRLIEITSSVYHGPEESEVIDFTLVRKKNSTKTIQEIEEELRKLIAIPNALLLLTQPSRFLIKENNIYRPFAFNQVEDLLALRQQKVKLQVDPGHVCAGVTDEAGLLNQHLSFRRGQSRPIPLQGNLHPSIYGKDQPLATLAAGQFVDFWSEIEKAARCLFIDPTSKIHLSVVRGPSLISQFEHLGKRFARIQKDERQYLEYIYNLFTAYISQDELASVKQRMPEIVNKLEELMYVTEKIKYDTLPPDGLHRIAAHACGHVLIYAVFEDSHLLEKKKGPDLTTQHYAAHIISDIIQDSKYLLASPLLDSTANVISDKGLDFGK